MPPLLKEGLPAVRESVCVCVRVFVSAVSALCQRFARLNQDAIEAQVSPICGQPNLSLTHSFPLVT